MTREEYHDHLRKLQEELNDVARWVVDRGQRLLVIFEGRDGAGKGGAIQTIAEHLNPRMCRIVALPKPSEREAGEWYFQRYVRQLPSKGEIVLLDRSWYNRAGVERVMGYCSKADIKALFRLTPGFERAITADGIHLLKYYLTCDQREQEQRFQDRLSDPLKQWKLSPVDLAAREKYDEYSKARDEMLKRTDTKHAPWTLVDFNDQKVGRLTLLRHLLDHLPAKRQEFTEGRLTPLPSKLKPERFDEFKPIRRFRA